MNILIIHYNTPELTAACVKSINHFTKNAKIYIFENSDKAPFVNIFNNVEVLDNTKGQIVDFDKELKKYPNRRRSLGRFSKYGSFKHCLSVDKCFDLINDNFILMDSDILIKKDVSELYDQGCMFVGEVRPWSWNRIIDGKPAPVHDRIDPRLCFINVKMAKVNGIRYFDEQHMVGTYFKDLDSDSWDTGCWFYDKSRKFAHKEIVMDDYMIHFGGGSYASVGVKCRMTKERWLEANKTLWSYTNTSDRKKVIYTCVTGGYDALMDPKAVSAGFDYVCYTDDSALTSTIWTVKMIPDSLSGLTNQLKNRYIKMHPHEFFKDYDLSIYVDSNVELKKDVNELLAAKCNDGDVFFYKHPSRKCIYDEMDAVLRIKKDKPENVNPQREKYKKEGYPEKNGLSQNNIIIRRHNTDNCKKLMDAWWNELLNGSYRDQLCLFYVLWKNKNLKITVLPDNLGNSPYFHWKGIHSRRRVPKNETTNKNKNPEKGNSPKKTAGRGISKPTKKLSVNTVYQLRM